MSFPNLFTGFASTGRAATISKCSPGAWEEAGSDEDVLVTMMAVVDANRDGFVEFEEFKRRGREGREDKLKEDAVAGGRLMEDVFRSMEKDGDGRLSYEDLRSYMVWAGQGTSEDEIKVIIRLGGSRKAEGVSLDGLMKVLAVDEDDGFF
ncbi:hypothetical protein BT93_L1142 [Corymbia citriodora subsp. variegata]|uniref:EF-hand domain-containing protein n=1 Tax=Corymbia citriodora subsp. variegata TaxID=360336 RepID=A0A8T0CWS4_CORYI|nr:hypothetical protein BT93_L1142 [Corymbia citriodora subsp. variegata]